MEEIDFAKAAFIICKDPEPVLNAIFKNLQRGATIINTIGSYTQKPNYIVLAVVSKKRNWHIKKPQFQKVTKTLLS